MVSVVVSCESFERTQEAIQVPRRMKKRARSKKSFPFDVLGENGVANTRKLALARTPGSVHDNLLQFLQNSIGCSASLKPQTEGPYLSFPMIDDTTKADMRKRHAALGLTCTDVDFALCGLCEPICVAQCQAFLETGSCQLAWDDFSPLEQLAASLAPCEEAGIGLAPCHLPPAKAWDASVRLWSTLKAKTVADFQITRLEQLLLGHRDFIGIQVMQQAKTECVVLPFFVVNYLQDEMRHELHVIGAVLKDEKLAIIDPNGVCPENFGEPNALMLSLPWSSEIEGKRECL